MVLHLQQPGWGEAWAESFPLLARDAVSAGEQGTILRPLLPPSGIGQHSSRPSPSKQAAVTSSLLDFSVLKAGSSPVAKRLSWKRNVKVLEDLAAENLRALLR